jgi:hypothetical protein
VGEWLGNAGAMLQAAGGWLVKFWGMWCRVVMKVGCIGYVVVMVVGDRGCGNLVRVVGECCSLAEVVEVGWC